jgi:TetR/AcrR family fatty acid metabolism transcriptional regulator
MRDPDKPQQIIDAAIRVFARKGYYNSRVSDIAREAGIAAGTIYLYFKTKDEILITLFRDRVAQFVSSVRKAISDLPDPVSKLRRLVALHFEMLEQNPELAEVVQVELRQGQKFFRGASSQEIASYFALIASVIDEGVAEGRFRRGLPVAVATKTLFGAMDQLATSWVLGRRGYRLVDSADALADLFLYGAAAPRPDPHRPAVPDRPPRSAGGGVSGEERRSLPPDFN